MPASGDDLMARKKQVQEQLDAAWKDKGVEISADLDRADKAFEARNLIEVGQIVGEINILGRELDHFPDLLERKLALVSQYKAATLAAGAKGGSAAPPAAGPAVPPDAASAGRGSVSLLVPDLPHAGSFMPIPAGHPS